MFGVFFFSDTMAVHIFRVTGFSVGEEERDEACLCHGLHFVAIPQIYDIMSVCRGFQHGSILC